MIKNVCNGITKAGMQCKLAPKYKKGYCHLHLPITSISSKPNENYREELSDIEGNRDRFVGSFKRVGSKPGTLTILLGDIHSPKEPNKILSDHSWFNFTNGFKELGHFNVGDKLSFTARIKRYEKGKGNGATFDYKFYMPLDIQRVIG